MQDLTVPADGGTTAAPDARRAAANQALADAVLEWLRANHQIPEDREVAAVDFAVTFTVKWLTPTGRVGRHTGTIIPPGRAGPALARRHDAAPVAEGEGPALRDRPARRRVSPDHSPSVPARVRGRPLDGIPGPAPLLSACRRLLQRRVGSVVPVGRVVGAPGHRPGGDRVPHPGPAGQPPHRHQDGGRHAAVLGASPRRRRRGGR